jgi:hypothetical protein
MQWKTVRREVTWKAITRTFWFAEKDSYMPKSFVYVGNLGHPWNLSALKKLCIRHYSAPNLIQNYKTRKTDEAILKHNDTKIMTCYKSRVPCELVSKASFISAHFNGIDLVSVSHLVCEPIASLLLPTKLLLYISLQKINWFRYRKSFCNYTVARVVWTNA